MAFVPFDKAGKPGKGKPVVPKGNPFAEKAAPVKGKAPMKMKVGGKVAKGC